MLLDPADAVLVHFFGFLGQHGILQVCPVEAHGKPESILDGIRAAFSFKILNKSFKNLSKSDWDGGRTPVAESY